MQHDDDFFEFHPFTPRSRTRFQVQAFPFTDFHLLPTVRVVVDITYKSDSIFVVLSNPLRMVEDTMTAPSITSFSDMYRDLAPELQRLIDHVEWLSTPDIIAIAKSVQEGMARIGVSDGSVRENEGRASHAWIIQTQQGSKIRGHGPVDGTGANHTSHCAELQGHTAIFSCSLSSFNILVLSVAKFGHIVTTRWWFRRCKWGGDCGDIAILKGLMGIYRPYYVKQFAPYTRKAKPHMPLIGSKVTRIKTATPCHYLPK